MKLIAFLIITLSIIAGSMASSTAYLAPLASTSRETLSTLRLTSPAGAYDPGEADDGFLRRLGEVRAVLDAERAVEANPLKPPASPRTPAPVPEVDTAPTGEQVLRARESAAPIGRQGMGSGRRVEADVAWRRAAAFGLAPDRLDRRHRSSEPW